MTELILKIFNIKNREYVQNSLKCLMQDDFQKKESDYLVDFIKNIEFAKNPVNKSYIIVKSLKKFDTENAVHVLVPSEKTTSLVHSCQIIIAAILIISIATKYAKQSNVLWCHFNINVERLVDFKLSKLMNPLKHETSL